MRKLLCLLALGLTVVQCGPNVKTLINAGEALAHMPLQNDKKSLIGDAVPEVQPTYFDLAVSRLQAKVDEVIDSVWKSLDDKRKFLMMQERGLAKDVLEIFGLLKNDIFAIEQQLDNANFENSLKVLAVPPSMAEDWLKTQSEFSKIIGNVKLHYSIFDDYMNNAGSTNQLQLEDYARSIIQPGSTSQKTAMLTTLSQLNDMAIPKHNAHNEDRQDVMFKVFSIFDSNHENMCNLVQSPNQYLMNLYNLIAITEIKGYMMVQFSYVVFKMYGHDSLTLESDISRRKFSTNTVYKISYAKEILESASTRFWLCDAKNPQEGINYIRLTNLLQGHLENEVDMNTLGSCRDNCGAYGVAEPIGCYKDMFCAKQSSCRGRLFDCQFFNADAWVCLSQNNERKYDWIEYENGIKLGQPDQCINKVKVDSWWRFLFHCSYCLCLCDSQGAHSDRYWSLLSQVSDIGNNKIVVGVRFVKKNRVVHLEIEQATALSEGNINPSSREWIEAAELDVSNATQKELGYFKTMTYEERALDMDHILAPNGYVITGVRLRNLGGHLNMEVRVTPIRFSSGQLISERTVWIGNDNTPASLPKRTQQEIISPDIPTKYMGMSKIDSQTNQFILFGATSALKDVSQTTVPYIDSQYVSPKVGSWLSGVGLYHKGAIGYGGYVGAMVTTYDLSRHLVPKKLNSNYAYTIQ